MNQTICYKENVYIKSGFSAVGPKESQGPLGEYFDVIIENDKNKKTYELSESDMQLCAIKGAMLKGNLSEDDINLILSGDLVNELIVSSFASKEFDIPFMGLYNACATFGEALILGASFISSQLMNNVICSSSSHFSTVERQFRYPLELGTQPTPTCQWTVTGSGCTILSIDKSNIYIDCATIGKVIDMGIKDPNNMGAAMAPAAHDTLVSHFKDTNRDTDYYDYIFTGDLGGFGSDILRELMLKSGYKMGDNYYDCGREIFAEEKTIQGGSGAGCSNVVFNSYIMNLLNQKSGVKVLFAPTGALLSKVSSLQGESIPCICHALSITS